jgi:hypothetical protein
VSKPLFFRGKWRRNAKAYAKRKAKAGVKRAWRGAKNAGHRGRERHRETRSRGRTARDLWREQELSTSLGKRHGSGKGASFAARHPILTDLKDGMAQKGHQLLDRRDLRSGIITQDELDALDKYDSQEEWRQDMLARRKDEYRRQRARDRDVDHGPLTMAYGGGQRAGVPQVKHVGFRPPNPRPSKLQPDTPGFTPPNSRPNRRRRKDRVPQLVDKWGDQLRQNGQKAMAADAGLNGAASSVKHFAEQFPESRSEIHGHLGAMAAFGKAYSEAMSSFMATLSQGKGTDNPGLPPEVIQHLSPLTEVGDDIERSCQATVAAWEDYYADAIKVAQDEHVPNDLKKLTS